MILGARRSSFLGEKHFLQICKKMNRKILECLLDVQFSKFYFLREAAARAGSLTGVAQKLNVLILGANYKSKKNVVF